MRLTRPVTAYSLPDGRGSVRSRARKQAVFARIITSLCLLLLPAVLMGQGGGVTPAELLKPLKDSWPTYNGDYTGKRYSALTQVNQTTVKHLSLAWMTRVTSGPGGA